MTIETRRIVEYRLQRARETIQEANSLLRDGHLNGAMNRIYYVLFYAAIALLATRDLGSSRHSGVIALFHDNFVRTRLFPRELAQLLGQAFDLRSRGDYRDFVVLDESHMRELLAGAQDFVAKVEEVVARLTQP